MQSDVLTAHSDLTAQSDGGVQRLRTEEVRQEGFVRKTLTGKPLSGRDSLEMKDGATTGPTGREKSRARHHPLIPEVCWRITPEAGLLAHRACGYVWRISFESSRSRRIDASCRAPGLQRRPSRAQHSDLPLHRRAALRSAYSCGYSPRVDGFAQPCWLTNRTSVARAFPFHLARRIMPTLREPAVLVKEPI